jgi:hypothetical protein
MRRPVIAEGKPSPREELARAATEPLLSQEAFDASWRGLFGSVALPGAAQETPRAGRPGASSLVARRDAADLSRSLPCAVRANAFS